MKQQHDTGTGPVSPFAETGTEAAPPFRAAAARRSTGRTQDIDRHVGARVRERRIMLGLTQQQLADLQRKLRTQRGRFPRRQLTSSKRGRSLRRAIILTFRTTRNCKPLFVPDTCIRSA